MCRVVLRRLVAGPRHTANFGHRGEAVVQCGRVALGFPRVAPRRVDADPPLAVVISRKVALVVGAWRRQRAHDIPSQLPGVARYRSALMPGRKKYAPPLRVVKAGRPLSTLRIGRLGIVYSREPSWAPTIGSRSLPSSWNARSLIQTFCANSN